jgi:signal transduction histidine kinase
VTLGLEDLPGATLALAEDGSIVAAGGRLLTEVGHEAGLLVGRPLDAVLARASRLYYRTQVQPALTLGGRIDEVYLNLVAPDGAPVAVIASAARDRAAGLTVLTLLPIARRAAFEQQLILTRRTAEELLRTRSELLERRDEEARENARLAERLRELAARLEAEHASTARAAARALHEGVAQDIAALRFTLDQLRQHSQDAALKERLPTLEALAAQTLVQVRELSYDLYPAAVEHTDAAGAVRAAVRAVEDTEGVVVAFSCETPRAPAEREVRLVLYRFVEEALRSTAAHGPECRAEVTVAVRGTTLEVGVCAASPAAGTPDPELTDGLGVLAARERLRRIGGVLDVDADGPGGVRLVARIPLEPAPAAAARADDAD